MRLYQTLQKLFLLFIFVLCGGTPNLHAQPPTNAPLPEGFQYILAEDVPAFKSWLAKNKSAVQSYTYQEESGPPHYLAKGDTLLHCAAYHNQYEMVQLLLEAGSNPNQQNEQGAIPLHTARGRVLRLLVQYKSNVNARSKEGYTPFSGTVFGDNLDDAEFLLKQGADPNAFINSERNLCFAIRSPKESTKWVLLLLRYHVNINLKNADEEAYSPLDTAILMKYASVIRLLLEKGANPNTPDGYGYVPYMKLLHSLDMTRLCIAKGANIYILDGHGESALTQAVRQGNPSVVQYLLKRGVNPNAHKGKGSLPLEAAVGRDDLSLLRLLLRHGANIREHRSTLIEQAVSGCKYHTLRYLLQHKQGRQAVDSHLLFTALDFYTAYAHQFRFPTKDPVDMRNTVEVLLQHGASPNVQNEKGETPLFFFLRKAVQSPNEGAFFLVADALIRGGTDLGRKNRQGESIKEWIKKQKTGTWETYLKSMLESNASP